MIISKNTEADHPSFEALLKDAKSDLEMEVKKSPKDFVNKASSDFEKDVYHSFLKASAGTPFEGTIQLVIGHRFPDIVARKYYGVEVKVTKQDHWRSTGNSVLESTRVEGVERIYLFFGKLTTSPEFKIRRYEECLYDIAVTHSPRYLIDMDLAGGKTIFDKMRTKYDDLRKSGNPIREVVRYYRKIAKKGEETWWMDGGEDAETVFSPTVKTWSNLPEGEQNQYRNEAMARFPEIFGRTQTKYQNLAAWLAAHHGVVDSSLRDRFTAGGQKTIEVNGVKYKKIPRIFGYLKDNAKEVIEIVNGLSVEDVKYYWGLDQYLRKEDIVEKWVELVIQYSIHVLPSSKKFIIHLLGDAFGEGQSPRGLKEAMRSYGLKF